MLIGLIGCTLSINKRKLTINLSTKKQKESPTGATGLIPDPLFTAAIPLLRHAGAFACYVSVLSRALLLKGLRQPGGTCLRGHHHIYAALSVDS